MSEPIRDVFSLELQKREVLPPTGHKAVFAQVDTTGRPIRTVTADGQVVGGGVVRRLRIAAFGDSFTRNGWRFEFPWATTVTGSIAGIGVEGAEQLIGASAGTLTVNAAARTVSFNGGATVPLRSGIMMVPGATGLFDGVALRVNLPDVVSGTLTVQRSGSRADETYGGENALAWAQIFSGQSIEFVNYAAGGLTVNAMAGESGQVADVIAAGALNSVDAIYFCAGTNDVSAGRTLAQLQADVLDVLNRLASRGVPVIVGVQPALRQVFEASASQRGIMSAYVQWLRSVCRTDSRLIFCPLWDALNPESGVQLRAGFAQTDRTHPAVAGAQIAGQALWRALGSPTGAGPFFGGPDNAVSASNPLGNFLQNPYLTGNVSGAPTSYGLNNSNATSTASKVARTDGVAGEWAQIQFSGTADGGNSTLSGGQFVSGQYPSAYERVRLFAEFECQGAQLAPDVRINVTGSDSRFGRALVNDLTTQALPIATYSGVLATAPVLIKPGDTGFSVFLQGFGTASTTNAQVRFGRLLLQRAPA